MGFKLQLPEIWSNFELWAEKRSGFELIAVIWDLPNSLTAGESSKLYFTTIVTNLAIWLANLLLSTRVQTTLLPSMCHALGHALKKHFLWRWYCGKKQIEIWFSVVCTLINNDTRHHSGAAEWVHNKFWPLWWRASLSIRVQTTLNHSSICFLPQFQHQRKSVFQSTS